MDNPRFVYVTLIATTPEKLWQAITTPSFIEQYWFGRRKESDWKAGSALRSSSPEGKLEWHGEILQSEPPRVLVYTFEVVGETEPASRVSFRIDPLEATPGPRGQAVRLTVTHEDFPPDSTIFKGIVEGWPAILSGLKTLVETGHSLGLEWKTGAE